MTLETSSHFRNWPRLAFPPDHVEAFEQSVADFELDMADRESWYNYFVNRYEIGGSRFECPDDPPMNLGEWQARQADLRAHPEPRDDEAPDRYMRAPEAEGILQELFHKRKLGNPFKP